MHLFNSNPGYASNKMCCSSIIKHFVGQCPELKPVINSSVDGCQVLLQDSLSYTCSFDGDSIQWFSSIWLDSIFVNIGATGPLPPLLVTGITMSASTFNVAGCLNSTLTFTGNLAALNGTQLFCRFGELFDNYTIVIPGKNYLKNHYLVLRFFRCSGASY